MNKTIRRASIVSLGLAGLYLVLSLSIFQFTPLIGASIMGLAYFIWRAYFEARG